MLRVTCILTVCLKVNGRTALHFAAGWGQATVTDMLLRNGSDVDVIDKAGMSSLHMAARQAHVETIQLLLRHGASAFSSVKKGIFKGRLAIDFAITAKSKEATSLLLLAMQKPQGWPFADVRKFVEAALASFRSIAPAGAPKPRKADLSVASASSPQLGPARVGGGGGGGAFVIPEEDAEEQELLRLMDDSTLPIFIKDSRGRYLYCFAAFLH